LSGDQAIASALSLVIGGALTLVAVLVAVSAAFTRLKSK